MRANKGNKTKEKKLEEFIHSAFPRFRFAGSRAEPTTLSSSGVLSLSLSLDKKERERASMASPHHPVLSGMNRGVGASKQQQQRHRPSAIAAFSVEAYSTLEAESRAHLAAVAAAAAFRRRRDADEGEEGNGADEEETAAATAAEVCEREREGKKGAVEIFHLHFDRRVGPLSLLSPTQKLKKKNS